MSPNLLIAGGGTGGHLFPGVAVAEEFLARDPKTDVLFVVTGRPVEAKVLDPRGLKSTTISASGLKGKGLVGKLRSLISLPVGFFQSLWIMIRFRPDVVLGVGGYVTGPVGLAARILGKTTAIHEQNSVPGLANRLLGRIVNLVFISFESSAKFFPAGKTHLTGNPIRKEILAVVGRGPKADGLFTLLIAGGSQGAHAVNQAAVEAVRVLVEAGREIGIIHQTGSADFEEVRAEYEKMGILAEVQPFISDMERAYLAADLVVCRAGALSVSEIAAVGRPAVFIPLPTAADNHQETNAAWLVEAGAAEMLLQKDMTPEVLAAIIGDLNDDPDRLEKMARAAAEAALTAAAAKICDICLTRIKPGDGGKNV